MIAASSSAPRRISDGLVALGWQSGDRLQSDYSLEIPQGRCLLKKSLATSQSGWTEWFLESTLLPVVDPSSIFAANALIPGPWKFLQESDGTIRCRGDVPRDVFQTDDSYDLITGKPSSPVESWAEITTAVAKGEQPTGLPAKPAAASLIDWLKEQGFVASADGGLVRVTVPLSGTFREVAIDWQDQGLVRLTTEIGRLENWSEQSLKAADEFLREANRRLRLVRIARPSDQTVFSMEVCFRAPGPGVWLQAALDALCTGMALVVQPLASLRDPRVADMLLAGTSACT